MAGRPRKSIELSTGKIGKENIKNRKEQESKLRLGRDYLTPPSWLKEDGQEEFLRIVEECKKIDILDNLDLGVLAIYCNAYSNYIETTEQINREGLVLSGEKKEYMNPAINVQEKLVKQILQCSSKLGLATTDRLKLVVPTKEEDKPNKFIELIKGANLG